MFLDRPEYISTFWLFVIEIKVIEKGSFVASTNNKTTLEFTVEFLSSLGILSLVRDSLTQMHYSSKINMTTASDYKNTLLRVELKALVLLIST